MNKERSVLSVVALLACAMLTGCGSEMKPHDRLIGEWEAKIELDQSVVQQRLSEAPEQLEPGGSPYQVTRARLQKQYEEMATMLMKVDFEKDGAMRITANVGDIEQKIRGTWELTKHEGDTLTVKLTESESGADEKPLTFDGNDSFIMAPPGADTQIGVMRFRRLR